MKFALMCEAMLHSFRKLKVVSETLAPVSIQFRCSQEAFKEATYIMPTIKISLVRQSNLYLLKLFIRH